MISHHHGVLFVHIPKCGGQSLERAFLSDLGLDWETRAPLLLRYNDTPRIGPPRLAHMTAQEYLAYKYITQEQYDRYFRFAIVRCPLRRAVSLYNYLGESKLDRFGRLAARVRSAGGFGPGYTFDRFLEDMIEANFRLAPTYQQADHGYPGHYWFIRPQSDFVLDAKGNPAVEVYKLENLAQAADEIRARANLVSTIPHENKSVPKMRVEDLTEHHTAQLRRIYAADFRNFGY